MRRRWCGCSSGAAGSRSSRSAAGSAAWSGWLTVSAARNHAGRPGSRGTSRSGWKRPSTPKACRSGRSVRSGSGRRCRCRLQLVSSKQFPLHRSNRYISVLAEIWQERSLARPDEILICWLMMIRDEGVSSSMQRGASLVRGKRHDYRWCAWMDGPGEAKAVGTDG